MELNTAWILQFLQNVCLFAAIVLCYREIIRVVRNERQRILLLGLLFGAAAIVGTMLPVALPTGHAFDAEMLPIGLSALFGGPIVALIAALIVLLGVRTRPASGRGIQPHRHDGPARRRGAILRGSGIAHGVLDQARLVRTRTDQDPVAHRRAAQRSRCSALAPSTLKECCGAHKP